MTKRHDDIFDAVLSGVPTARDEAPAKARGAARFLKRGNAISDRLSGENEEKTLHWVDPDQCRMWARHNRDYSLLTEENCRDLIEGIRAQGKQEFPAIVRRVEGPEEFEVICGARRHFAVSWLRANNYPQFRYLVEVRDLSDEEAFRLADIENRDREDISDYERAKDYAEAVKLYYGGKQKAMAERLEVSAVWLSRYLELARLPQEVIQAFPTIRDVKELHARTLKPMLKLPKSRDAILAAARDLADRQQAAREGQGAFVDAARVIGLLKASTEAPKPRRSKARVYKGAAQSRGMTFTKRGDTCRLEFPADLTPAEAQAAFTDWVDQHFLRGATT